MQARERATRLAEYAGGFRRATVQGVFVTGWSFVAAMLLSGSALWVMSWVIVSFLLVTLLVGVTWAVLELRAAVAGRRAAREEPKLLDFVALWLADAVAANGPLAGGDPSLEETRLWHEHVLHAVRQRQRTLDAWKRAHDRIVGVHFWRDRPELVALESDVRRAVLLAFNAKELDAAADRKLSEYAWRPLGMFWMHAKLSPIPPRTHVFHRDHWYSGPFTQCRYGHLGPHTVMDGSPGCVLLECSAPDCGARWTEKLLT